MAFKSTGFTDVVNAASHGLVSTCEIDFNVTSFPIGSMTITSGTTYSAANVGNAVDVIAVSTNFSDLWTTITAYNGGSTNSTASSVAVDGSNNVTILLT